MKNKFHLYYRIETIIELIWERNGWSIRNFRVLDIQVIIATRVLLYWSNKISVLTWRNLRAAIIEIRDQMEY